MNEDYQKLAVKRIGDREAEALDDIRRQRGMAPRVPEDKGVVPPAPAGVPGAGSAMAPGAPAPQTINPAKTGAPAPAQQVGSQMKPPAGTGGITDVAGIKPDFKKAEYYERTSPQYAELFKAEMELEEMEKGSGKFPRDSKKQIANDVQAVGFGKKYSKKAKEVADGAEDLGFLEASNEMKESAETADRHVYDKIHDGPNTHEKLAPRKVLKSDIEEIDNLLNELEKARVPEIHPKDKLRFEGDTKHTPGLEKDEPEK